MKIMIVDDDLYMADLISTYLKRDSCDVMIYSGMSDGLRHMMEEKVDAVILDLHMPGMSAIDALPIVKEINPKAVVGIVSSDGSSHAKSAALSAGADFFLQKCNDIPNIMDAIKVVSSEKKEVIYGKNYSTGRV